MSAVIYTLTGMWTEPSQRMYGKSRRKHISALRGKNIWITMLPQNLWTAKNKGTINFQSTLSRNVFFPSWLPTVLWLTKQTITQNPFHQCNKPQCGIKHVPQQLLRFQCFCTLLLIWHIRSCWNGWLDFPEQTSQDINILNNIIFHSSYSAIGYDGKFSKLVRNSGYRRILELIKFNTWERWSFIK